jgi:hypothetical protein
MRKLAELFVEHSREDGYTFDEDPAFIHVGDARVIGTAFRVRCAARRTTPPR